MKKAIMMLTVCAAISPLTFAETASNADTKGDQPVAKVNKKISLEQTKEDESLLKNVSGSLAFVTNYVFRGNSQSRNLPAVQGGLTYTFPINVYLNVWGSNVNFPGTGASVELDTVIGYSNTYGDNFAYDINIGRYNYPGARGLNYNELNTLVNFYFLQAGISYSANVFNVHQTGIYYTGGVNYDIPAQYAFGLCDVNLLAMMGHYTLPRAAGNSYNDYNIALSKSFKNYTVTAQWTGTNGRQNISPFDDNQVIGQVAASF